MITVVAVVAAAHIDALNDLTHLYISMSGAATAATTGWQPCMTIPL
jgi:hypothetical protein